MKKKSLIISFIVIVGLLIGGTTYYYLQISPTNYNQTKHQAQKSLQTAMIMRTDVSIKEADNLIDKLSTKDRRPMETKLSELKTSIKMLTKASNLVTLAENVRTQSNYEKAQKAIKKLDSRLFSKDINILNTRLDNIKKRGFYQIPNN
ncbi:hypothetical protein OGZ44_01470 [Lactococcus lactis]|uniref:hypothetical protein n=1 Tax=Lactococcus lactis TaxID=1358 RepID=UPI002415E57C|nr:hypothetical protein [Lactococcus lactis]MDG4972927.1 hypothetical protein [Lactococcus lactis]